MKYNGNNLQEVLEAHKRWIDEEDGWSENDRADFTRANLAGADLVEANLCGANLYEADLTGANLRVANLCGANLSEANLTEANLTKAIMNGANLIAAKLTGANLTGADLRGANLHGADLTEADLYGANLYEADLTGAILTGAKNIPFIPLACPDSGAFIGWKKCLIMPKQLYDSCLGILFARGVFGKNPAIVKLLIPEDADRSSSTGRKCRASCATVLEIQTLDGEVIADAQSGSDIVALSDYDKSFKYIPGETVRPREPFNANRWSECASGIHFFINRQEAVDY